MQVNLSSHFSSLLESQVDFEVKDAEGDKWHNPSDDQFGQVVVVEDVVDVETEFCGQNPDDSLVDQFGCVGCLINPEIRKLALLYTEPF